MSERSDKLLISMEKNKQLAAGIDPETGGVSAFWISDTFKMDIGTVRRKLASVPTLARRKGGHFYDPVKAIKKVFGVGEDIETYLQGLKAKDLPENLRAEYWDAKLKHQRWAEKAGHLWRTEDVQDVLGETFKTIKFTIQLWAENLERETQITDEQRSIIIRMCDGLQDEIYKSLVEQAERKATPSSLTAEEDGSKIPEDVDELL